MEPTVEHTELMARIRAAIDAENRARAPSGETTRRPALGSAPVSTPSAPATAPYLGRDSLELALAEATSMLPRARRKTEVDPAVPKLLRSFYRNQGGFNGILLEISERLLSANRQLEQQNVQLYERMEALEAAMARQQERIQEAGSPESQDGERTDGSELYPPEPNLSVAEYEARLRRRLERARGPGAGNETVDDAESRPRNEREKLQARIDAVDNHANRLGDHLKNLQRQVDEQREQSLDWNVRYRQAAAHDESQARNTRRLEERQHSDAAYFKNQLWFLQRLIDPLLPVTNPPTAPAASTAGPTPAVTAEHGLDALYLAFEDAMRGDRDEIKERIRVYLPRIAAANAGTPERPVLDLGCGRGEWLELLGEQGYTASGVDLNVCMIELCRERGLPVTFADALEHLRGLPDASCGAVTAFHLIEHLPIPVLVPFLRDCRRVLQPGGVAIFETPNPYNILVGSGYFYHDFTHQRPLPPTSTKFLVEQMGFSKVEVLPLNPWDEAAKVHGDEAKTLEGRFNELVYGPQDYALIATP